MGEFLDIREAMIFTFDILIMKELSNIIVVKEESPRLLRVRYHNVQTQIVSS